MRLTEALKEGKRDRVAKAHRRVEIVVNPRDGRIVLGRHRGPRFVVEASCRCDWHVAVRQ